MKSADCPSLSGGGEVVLCYLIGAGIFLGKSATLQPIVVSLKILFTCILIL
jgi:hypothetical protein